MPKARYKKVDDLYYTYVPTGELRADGYQKWKKIKAKTQAELDQKKQAYEQQLLLGVDPNKTTLRQWYELWIVRYKGGLAENTRNFYRNIYEKHVDPALGTRRLSELREIHGQAILGEVGKTHSQRTVKGVRTVLFSLLDTARANKQVPYNPFEHLKVQGGTKAKERRALTEEERKRYLQQIPQDPFGAFAAFLYFFGLRRGEALALTKADVSGDEIRITKQITFPDNNRPVFSPMPKTDAGIRSIPIPEKARRYIDFEQLPDGLLFADEDGAPLTLHIVTRRWNNFITTALGEETDITMHCLRHNYCTLLFDADVDLLTVMTLAGHENIETTLKIYTHYTESKKKKASKKVQKIG